jgi:penicillin amidase
LFYRATWSDEFKGDTISYTWPSRPVTLALLAEDTTSSWFDDKNTPERETAGDLARATFVEAVRLAQRSARPDSLGRATVSWGTFRPLAIPHLLRLPPLGVSGLAGDGCGECLNAQRGSHGPSWRMAVQIGKRPEAWGIYPGGQSGNPGSRGYDAFVQDWLAGRAYRLLFLNNPLEVRDSTAYLMTLWSQR